MAAIKFKRDTAFRKQFFVPDSFAHPAKMDAQLLIWIVERYTEVGETVLDPMAGSGTTMLACGLGRNVILVDLEEKFCKMMWDNKEQVKMRPQLGYEMGGCQIIQGDARNLEGLLADKIITSPPYCDSPIGGGLNTKPPREGHNDQSGRSSDTPSQVGAGQYDKIITSPPYAEAKSAITDKIWLREHQDELSQKSPSRKGAHQRENQHHERLIIPDNPSNIGNLTYGNIDAVITSPPYEGSISGESHTEEARAKEFDKLRKLGYKINPNSADNKVRGAIYSSSEANIGNLKSQSYLEAMLQVYQQCHKALKPNGLLILVTKNFIRNKVVVRLDLDTIKLCEQVGFELIERHYRELPAQSFWRVIYHQKYPEVELIDKEDILVFRQMVMGFND